MNRALCRSALALGLLSTLASQAASPLPEPKAAPASKVEALPVTAPSIAEDVVMRALQDELARARTLKMGGAERPYYLSAVCTEEEGFRVAASFGSLLSRASAKHTQLNVSVRVGTPALDNTNFADAGDLSFMRMLQTTNGQGSPAEADYDALRHELWLQFDDGYKAAVESIAKKRAFLEANQVRERPADFSAAQTTTWLEQRQPLKVDTQRWTKLVKQSSAVFRIEPAAASSTVTFSAQVNHQSFVNSDGAKHRFAEPLVQLQIQASTQASDGMELKVQREFTARTEAELPTDAALITATQGVSAHLAALAQAPVAAEDYNGPVLFSGRAAGFFFLRAVSDPLSHPRDDLGNQSSGRLVERLGKHITAKGITVIDDPTQKSWKGTPLLGYYPVDDDSVVPKPIVLVDDGVLKTYYMSRIPTPRLSGTNGHMRGDQGSAGNVFVKSVKTLNREQLKQKLLELAKEEDLDYGLLVDELDETGGRGFGGSDGAGVSLPAPVAVWRVYANGKEVLERGLAFKTAPYRILKDIVGMGDDPSVTNTQQRGQHVAIVAPSVLVKSMELQKVREENERTPYSPRPTLSRIP